ncbi:MAG TPA: hypothetical protein VM074_10585 [Solimonas sp.]|nr:hypothetical protein [Solimonas sp.]
MNSRLAVVATVLMGCCGAAAADTWMRDDEIGERAVRGVVDQTVALGATGRVEVSGIGGSVRVAVGEGDTVQLHYERAAASQQDYDCESLRYEPGPGLLTIRMERIRSRACRQIHARDSLTLTVPRGASLSLESIGDSVTVGAVEGMVRLSSIGDSATLDGVQQLRASSIGDSLRLKTGRIGSGGIEVDSVGDTVELQLPPGLGARLQIDSVGGTVRGHDLRLDALDGSFDTVLGAGGPKIRISSVGDDVIIR